MGIRAGARRLLGTHHRIADARSLPNRRIASERLGAIRSTLLVKGAGEAAGGGWPGRMRLSPDRAAPARGSLLFSCIFRMEAPGHRPGTARISLACPSPRLRQACRPHKAENLPDAGNSREKNADHWSTRSQK